MEEKSASTSSPSISVPKGGGAISGIGETFSPNLFTGTGNFGVPIYTSPGRDGFAPQLALSYSTGNGNGIFGLGWSLSIPRITRKTEKGLPRYGHNDNSGLNDSVDVFVMSGAEDLVPALETASNNPNSQAIKTKLVHDSVNARSYRVTEYKPRTEGLFAKIESWEQIDANNPNKIEDQFWRVISKDNVTSIYGRTAQSRIAESVATGENLINKHEKIYEWLLEETYDAKGNHIYYEYAADEIPIGSVEIFEKNRKYNNRYPRRILYGNVSSSLKDYQGQSFIAGVTRKASDHRDLLKTLTRHYLFEVVFNYSDWIIPIKNNDDFVYQKIPNVFEALKQDSKLLRPDPFSSYRAGFEVRTQRLCSNVLMVHHFLELGAQQDKGILVKSTDFTYKQTEDSKISLLQNATLTGYQKLSANKYEKSSLPPVDFVYSDFRPKEQSYQSITGADQNIPSFSLNDPSTALVDLFGNGLQDIVQTGPSGFRYWRNLGDGKLDQPHNLNESPAGLTLGNIGVSFADLGGDGLSDLLVLNGPVQGFFELEPEQVIDERLEGGWSNSSFKAFAKTPSINLSDSRLRMLDLTGDGLTDLLVNTDQGFIWYQSNGEVGYSDPQHVLKKGELRNIFFNDPSGRVRLADMTGDGLKDIVLVHNGRIDYWPNMGYGNFAKKISMQTEYFQLPIDFNPQRLYLADLDGSGTADLVYVDFNQVHFWFNQSGNGFSGKNTISGTPIALDNTSLSFTDFYSTGTSALIWSYDLGTVVVDGNYKILDFCGKKKPYLLTEMSNNLGATTRVAYASSTKFYLEDVKNKQFWHSPLPFPVQVVEKTESIDHISKTKLVTQYKYHHGFYDGREREFRGFGRVDQIDTEFFNDFSQDGLHSNITFINKDQHHHQPPVETRTWFHTGAYFEQKSLLAHYKKEYLAGLGNLPINERPQDNKAFDLGLNKIETTNTQIMTEAHRVLRGAILRSEVYAHDSSLDSNFPYVVSENTYRVKTIQDQGLDANNKLINTHAVFQSIPKENISYHYERVHSGRNLLDPRIQHELVLETDEFGNPTQSASIAYKRRQTSHPEQDQDLISISKNAYCNVFESPNAFRHSVAFESKQYELTGLTRNSDVRYQVASISTALSSSQSLAFEEKPTFGQIELRSLAHQVTQFWKDDLSGPENLGVIGTIGLTYESYTLALTPSLRSSLFASGAINTAIANAAGYQSKAGNIWQAVDQGDWWIPSGQQRFSLSQFYQAIEAIDAFGEKLTLQYDPYDLYPVRIDGPLGNRQEGVLDYRVLQNYLTRDINGNHSEVAFDCLGMLVATAIMGKAGRAVNSSLLGINGPAIEQMRLNTEADSLKGFSANLLFQDIDDLIKNPDGSANAAYSATLARQHLQQATSRVVYDLHAYRLNSNPVVSCSIVREEHFKVNASSDLQINLNYSDGFGREIQSKVQAEPLKVISPNTTIKRRWVVSGWTVFNNKGKAFQQFEPSFTDNITFEFGKIVGVSSTMFYDPMQRLVCTLNSNHSYEKVIFNPWEQVAWDANDTVLLEPQNDPDVKAYVSGHISTVVGFKTWLQDRIPNAASLPAILNLQQQAAVNSIEHTNTPSTSHLNVQGTVFLTVANNKTEIHETKVEIDIQGHDLSITDARNIKAFEHGFDMAGRKLLIKSTDAGNKHVFLAVDNNPVFSFDANSNTTLVEYDKLRRPIEILTTKPTGTIKLVERLIYGEAMPQAEVNNSRGVLWKHYDGAGLAITDKLDFKGNIIQASRQLLKDAKKTEMDWPIDSASNFDEAAAVTLLENNTHLNATAYSVITQYDALNRVIENTLPEGTKLTPLYNEASLLEKMSVQHVGQASEVYIDNIDYNAKGQRKKLVLGNGVITDYDYEVDTFRLKSINTSNVSSANKLQELSYVYDPVGNITSIRDDAHARIFNRNQVVDPISKYKYDAVYRLIEANGREHESMTVCHYQTNGKKHTEFLPMPQSSSNAQALVNYIEKYQYDKAGNITRSEHSNALTTRIRVQSYQNNTNRLVKSDAGCVNENIVLPHDANGNMTALPHLRNMVWDYKNQLVEVQLNIGTNPNKAFYQYDSSGQRIRKLVVKSNGNEIQERIYLGPYEIYTERLANNIVKQRDSIHVSDDQGRIALIDRERNTSNLATISTTVKRYQLSNHLGSSSQELDEAGSQISYEEYYPYGGTAYTAGNDQVKVSLKRYRYSGKERDDETGLYYYGARYYAPWLARWVSCDPIGVNGGINLFLFSANSPISFKDDLGYEPSEADLNNVNYDTDSETCFEARSCGDEMSLVSQGNAVSSPNSAENIESSGVEKSSFKGKAKQIFFATFMVMTGLVSAVEKADPPLLDTPADIVNGDFVDNKVAGIQDSLKPKGPPPPPPPPPQKLLTDGGKGKQGLLTDGGKGKQGLLTDGGKGKQGLLTDGGKGKQARLTDGGKGRASSSKASGGKVRGVLKGAKAVVGVASAGINGYKVGTGVNEIIEGKTAEGLNHSAWTATGLIVELGGAKAVEAGVLAAGGGSAALLGAGLAMGGSLWLAEESISAALEGRPTPIDEAGDFYVDLALEVFGYE